MSGVGVMSVSVDFNPRSRVGNDENVGAGSTEVSISIHVPAWGTTLLKGVIEPVIGISIHVPAWGTTMQNAVPKQVTTISIHVPAWGTTVRLLIV